MYIIWFYRSSNTQRRLAVNLRWHRSHYLGAYNQFYVIFAPADGRCRDALASQFSGSVGISSAKTYNGRSVELLKANIIIVSYIVDTLMY